MNHPYQLRWRDPRKPDGQWIYRDYENRADRNSWLPWYRKEEVEFRNTPTEEWRPWKP